MRVEESIQPVTRTEYCATEKSHISSNISSSRKVLTAGVFRTSPVVMFQQLPKVPIELCILKKKTCLNTVAGPTVEKNVSHRMLRYASP